MRDVDVFKILVRLVPNVAQQNSIKEQNKQKLTNTYTANGPNVIEI